ncbi:hypothetical protein K8R43_02315 [archaeon]|nr:hypothetical protein [archaeon]
MKKLALLTLALFFSTAFAMTAEDFSFRANPEGTEINVWVFVKNNPALDVTIKLDPLPDGVVLKENNTKRIPYLPPKSVVPVTWRAVITNQDADLDQQLKESLQVISWDDSISLQAFLVDEVNDNQTTNQTVETNKPEIMVFGKSDGTELCQTLSELPGEENEPRWYDSGICNARIQINDQQAVFVNDTGHFTVKAELTKTGLNQLNVTATDASGNSKTVILEAVYTGTDLPGDPSIDILSIILIILGALVVIYYKRVEELVISNLFILPT